jgi:hypothetical protein
MLGLPSKLRLLGAGIALDHTASPKSLLIASTKSACVLDHLVGVGHAHHAMGFHHLPMYSAVDHVGSRKAYFGITDSGTTDCGRDQVVDVPLVRVAAADAGQVRPGPLGAPLERMVVLDSAASE